MSLQSGSVGDADARTVEVRARTVDEAVARGLVRLGGLSRSEVEIEVVSEGRSGLLGFGTEEAVVRMRILGGERRTPATAPLEAPSPEAEERAVALAESVTLEYLRLLGYEDASVARGAALVPIEVEEEPSVVLDVSGTGARRLLANDGRPLLALQFLVRLAVNRQSGTWVNLLLDVDGDRSRRVKELLALAEQSAELVDREGRPVSLPPMTAYERRVVHLALRDHPTVTTQSIGRGEARKVTVRLKGQELPGV
jgi:spoIIIJ-associated protein